MRALRVVQEMTSYRNATYVITRNIARDVQLRSDCAGITARMAEAQAVTQQETATQTPPGE